jgi:uncharacterized protein
MMRSVKTAILGFLLGLALFGSHAAALDLPALSGRVVDAANVLDPATREALNAKLAALEAGNSDQLVVVTLPSLQGVSIENFGIALIRHWGIGQKGRNNGALLIVAPQDRKVRIEVGYGLEGALTDLVSRLIIENAILPRFRANDFPGGISRGVDDIIQVLNGDNTWQQRAAQRPESAPDVLKLLVFALALSIVGYVIFRILFSWLHPIRSRGGHSGSDLPYWAPVTTSIPVSSGSGWSDSSGGFSGGGGDGGGGGASGSW